MKNKTFFYTISAFGFFFPYILKFLIASSNTGVKIFAIYSLGKFNLIYFAIIIVFFFAGLIEKYSFLRTAQTIFVTVFTGYVLLSYFVFAKMDVQNYIKNRNPDAILVKISDLNKYPNFKIYYKKAGYAAVKILPKEKKSLPFNYKKDTAK
jgi:hypothetical protein